MDARPPPCQGSLLWAPAAPVQLLLQEKPLTSLSGVERPNKLDWQQFHQYLLQRMTPNTAEDRIRYAQRYASVLFKGDTSTVTTLVQLSPNKRIHVMKAISSLARYTGQQDTWRTIRQQYGLQWSTGTEKLDAFTRFFDSSKDLDTMLQWLREAIQVLPPNYANFYLFCTLTGLRATECMEAVRLLNTRNAENGETSKIQYYNPEQQMLQHYRFPELFLKRTKAVYISVVDDKIIGLAKSIDFTPTLIGLKKATMRRCLSMRVKYARKIYASFLRQQGIEPEIIDMLQGRTSKSIFIRHYMTPSADYKDRVLASLYRLQRAIES